MSLRCNRVVKVLFFVRFMKHFKLIAFYLSLSLCLAIPAAHAASVSAKQTPLTTINEYLGTLDGVGETLLVSPDCQHIAIVVQQGKEMAWQVDGQTPKYFSELGPAQWSPDSQHFAYSIPDGNNWRMLIDGKPDNAFDEVGFPLWSPDSSKLAYIAHQKQKSIIIYGNQKSQPFDSVTQLQFSADGSSLAAIVRRDGKDSLWIDGKISVTADEIAGFTWSQQGNHYAFAARNTNAWTVHHDDKSGQAVEDVQLLTISPDGQHVAYVATISGGTVVQLNSPTPRSNNTKTQLLIADEKTLDTQTNPGFTYTGIVYSPDSQHLAWTAGYFGQVVIPDPVMESQVAAKEPSGMHVFRDGKSGPGFTNVSAPVWSADSAHLAYGAVQIKQNDIQKLMVVDGKPSKAYRDITQPVWNPQNATLAYATTATASQDKSVVINDGKESPEYDTASDLLFSADGKYFSYLALDSKGVFAVINNQTSPRFDGFLGNTKSSFDSNGKLHAIALKGKQVVHVEFTFQDK